MGPVQRLAVAALAVTALALSCTSQALAGAPVMQLVSRADGPDGRVAGGFPVSVSADGRYVLFGSRDATLGSPSGLGNEFDFYVRDTQLGRTELVNRDDGANGAPVPGCLPGGMSADGRYVSLRCDAFNTSTHNRVLVRDRATQTTKDVSALTARFSVSPPSKDGRFVVVGGGDASGDATVRVDLATGDTAYVTRYSGADGARTTALNGYGALSPNGRYAVFSSRAQDLDAPRQTPPSETVAGPVQVWLRDLDTETTVLVSRADGLSGPRATQPATGVSVTSQGAVLFATAETELGGVTGNRWGHLLVRDTRAGHTTVVDRADGNAGALAPVPVEGYAQADDDRVVAFATEASLDGCTRTDFPAVYVRDLVDGTTRLVSRNGQDQANARSAVDFPALSLDGRHLAFRTSATNLDPPLRAGAFDGIYEVLDVTSVLAQPPRPACADGGGGGRPVPGDAPVCPPELNVTTRQDAPARLPSSPCTDPQGRPLRLEVVQPPAHGAVSGPDPAGGLTYAPARRFRGQDAFVVRASNGLAVSGPMRLIVTVSAPVDRTAPRIRWVAALRARRSGGASARIRCDEPCRVSLRLRVRRRGKTRAGPVKAVSAAAGRTVALILRSPPPRSRILPTGALAVGQVTDAAGNRRTLRITVRAAR